MWNIRHWLHKQNNVRQALLFLHVFRVQCNIIITFSCEYYTIVARNKSGVVVMVIRCHKNKKKSCIMSGSLNKFPFTSHESNSLMFDCFYQNTEDKTQWLGIFSLLQNSLLRDASQTPHHNSIVPLRVFGIDYHSHSFYDTSLHFLIQRLW